MTRSPSYMFVVLALAVVSLAAAGCKKDGGGKKVDKTTFKKFPATAQFVAGVDGKKLRQGKGYKKTLTRGLRPDVKALLAAMKSCGIDVIEGVDSLVVAAVPDLELLGLGAVEGAKPFALVNVTGFTRANFKQCGEVAREFAVKSDAATTTLTVRGKTHKLAWLGDDSFLGGAGWTADELLARTKATAGLDQNKAVMDMVGRVDTGAPVWFAFAPPEPVMLPMTGAMVGAYGTVSMDDGIDVKIGLRMTSDDDAKGAESLAMMLPQLAAEVGPLGKFVDKIKIKVDGRTVNVNIKLTAAEMIELDRAIRADPMLQEFLGEML